MSQYFDETLGASETIRFLNKWRDQIRILLNTTHFNREEIQNLFIIHKKLSREGGPINLLRFSQLCHTLFGITEESHYEKLYAEFDPQHTGRVDPFHWTNNLSTLLLGNLHQRIQFVWNVYVSGRDRYLTRETIASHLQKSIIRKKGDPGFESTMKAFVNMVLKKLDADMDGRVSFADFKETVDKNPLLLESLGQCLPSPRACSSFLTTFSTRAPRVQIVPYAMPQPQRLDLPPPQIILSITSQKVSEPPSTTQ